MRIRLVLVFAFFQIGSFTAAQDTIFVSCWTGQNSEVYRSRHVNGPIVSSASGERAYVAVSANTSGGGCFNVTQLFVATQGGEFRKVFEAHPNKTDDGNGLRLIGWNHSGTELLAELGKFTYGSDVAMSREIIIYDAKTAKISHFDVSAALSKHFGEGCAFISETTAWIEPDSAAVKVREYKEEWNQGQKQCVQRPTQFAVNLSTGVVSKMPTR